MRFLSLLVLIEEQCRIMSEFRIVKCKSCTAALVELEGQKLTKCVQCGYDFSQRTSKKAKLEAVVEQAFEKQFEQLKGNNKTSNITQTKPSQLSKPTVAQTTNANGQKSLPKITKKQSGSIIGTIIKWYVIIFIASKFIQEFF